MSEDSKPLFGAEGRDNRQSVRESLSRSAANPGQTAGQSGNTSDDEMAAWQPSLIDRIKSLGFVDDATRAFDLLPLVLVAWADGAIQAEERAKILELLQMRGLKDTPTYTMFEALLESEPAAVYLQAALTLLRELVALRPDGGASVVDLCVEVAAAASDAIGSPDPISAEERSVMAEIADALGPAAHAELTDRLGAGS